MVVAMKIARPWWPSCCRRAISREVAPAGENLGPSSVQVAREQDRFVVQAQVRSGAGVPADRPKERTADPDEAIERLCRDQSSRRSRSL